MRHIFEEYGDVIMQVLGGAGILALLWELLSADGSLRAIIIEFLKGAC